MQNSENGASPSPHIVGLVLAVVAALVVWAMQMS